MRDKRRFRRTAGMTLIELMVVLAIIGLVMGAMGVGAFRVFRRSQVKTAKLVANKVANAGVQFMVEHGGTCPRSVDEIAAKKFLDRAERDPWNRPFQFRCPGEVNTDGIDVVSVGPDGQPGTLDDIAAGPGAN